MYLSVPLVLYYIGEELDNSFNDLHQQLGIEDQMFFGSDRASDSDSNEFEDQVIIDQCTRLSMSYAYHLYMIGLINNVFGRMNIG